MQKEALSIPFQLRRIDILQNSGQSENCPILSCNHYARGAQQNGKRDPRRGERELGEGGAALALRAPRIGLSRLQIPNPQGIAEDETRKAEKITY